MTLKMMAEALASPASSLEKSQEFISSTSGDGGGFGGMAFSRGSANLAAAELLSGSCGRVRHWKSMKLIPEFYHHLTQTHLTDGNSFNRDGRSSSRREAFSFLLTRARGCAGRNLRFHPSSIQKSAPNISLEEFPSSIPNNNKYYGCVNWFF